MLKFSEKTSWESARTSTLFTAAALAASGRHEKLAKALEGQLSKWSSTEAARREAEDNITKANARVAASDYALDDAVKLFANELLRDAKGKTTDKNFRAYFPEAPHEVVRLGLESELTRCAELFVVNERIKVSKTATAALNAIKSAMEEGKKAIDARREAFVQQAQTSLDITSWKEATDKARDAVYVQLAAWAVERGEDRDYADRFFPTSAPRAKSVKTQPKEDGEKKGSD